MDFEALSNDELADVARDLFDELHRRVNAQPPGAFRNGAARRLMVAHRGMDLLREFVRDGGMIQPMSGGEEKPDEP